MDKKILREELKIIRNSLDIENISNKITVNILNSDFFNHSKDVLVFYPLKNEINILGLLSTDKNFYLPRVNGTLLDVCPYKEGDRLKKSTFNIKEPINKNVNSKILDLIIFPALALDKDGNRLGYGGGYYDRFAQNTKALKVGIIPEKQFLNHIPAQKHDIKMDIIVTENKIIDLTK